MYVKLSAPQLCYLCIKTCSCGVVQQLVMKRKTTGHKCLFEQTIFVLRIR